MQSVKNFWQPNMEYKQEQLALSDGTDIGKQLYIVLSKFEGRKKQLWGKNIAGVYLFIVM
jgi:hypothetical protein